MNVTKETLSHCHLVHHKPHLHWISVHFSVMKRTDGHNILLLRTAYSFCAIKSEINPFSLLFAVTFNLKDPLPNKHNLWSEGCISSSEQKDRNTIPLSTGSNCFTGMVGAPHSYPCVYMFRGHRVWGGGKGRVRRGIHLTPACWYECHHPHGKHRHIGDARKTNLTILNEDKTSPLFRCKYSSVLYGNVAKGMEPFDE